MQVCPVRNLSHVALMWENSTGSVGVRYLQNRESTSSLCPAQGKKTLFTSTWLCQQPQNSLGWLYRNEFCVACWIQMCDVTCLAISTKLIAIEMLLEPRWITSNQMLLLLFFAPCQLVIWMPTMWQLTWETWQVSGLSVCLCLIYL